jgi:glycosyltransferase involved in cell wall biosynthesis
VNILIDGHDISLVGGIERFTANFADAMTRRGHRVFLFTYSPPGTRHKFALNRGVTLVHYPFTGDPAHIPALRRQILACAPDVLVSPASFNNHLLWCAALAETDIPWIFSEHSDPWIIEKERWNQAERQAALCAADGIHLLLKGFVASVPAMLRQRTHVIPNPLGISPAQSREPRESGIALLSLGRLEANKQNHLLLDAFALLLPDFPQWRLEIWGEGEEYAHLGRRIQRLNLQDRAWLRGLAANPEKQYATADIFCFPSRHEGFGLVAVEAMSFSLPVVGFAGCAALNEIVRHGETGLLAPEMTAESLAASLCALMENESLRRTMGENARRATDVYGPERVFDAWEALLEKTAARRGKTRLRECLSGRADKPEIERHYALMREILRRKNVLLQNSQWARRIARRYPLLKKMIRPVRRLLRG